MTTKQIIIPQVSRVEGHGRVTIKLNDQNEVEKSHFHVDEFRGFEKFLEGRLLSEMPVITTRICGICPVSHHLAAAKACDAAFGVEIPPAAKKLRELMHMAQIMHSHAVHFFFLAAPDFIMGPDSDPAKRNLFGLLEADPELGKKAIRLRKVGQNIIERVGGRSIHPVTAIPGGMSKPLSHEDRFTSSKEIDDAIELAKFGIQVVQGIYEKYSDLIPDFAVLKSNYLSLVNGDKFELYDGSLRMIDEAGRKIDEFDPKSYCDYIGEHVEDWSYLKFPYYKKLGPENGIYRVGPLARLNIANSMSTPLANKELTEFKKLANGPVHQAMYFHYARLIEILYAAERIRELLNDDEIVSKEVRVKVERKEGEGVGVIEAPRGTLIHHYWADFSGKVKKANLVVATVHNNPSINRSVNEVARKYIHGDKIEEGALNKIEMAIRCYDPCLSCSTHALGKMPLAVDLVTKDGHILKTFEKH
jgi:NAD-reducing hydrogenase large subunit